jgi:hypothetical protein
MGGDQIVAALVGEDAEHNDGETIRVAKSSTRPAAA